MFMFLCFFQLARWFETPGQCQTTGRQIHSSRRYVFYVFMYGLIACRHRPPALVGCLCHPPPPTLTASHGSHCRQSVALTASALTSLSLGGPSVMLQKCRADCCRRCHRHPTIVELSPPCKPSHRLLTSRHSLLPSRPWWSPSSQQPTQWRATCRHHNAGGGWRKRGRAAEAAAVVGGVMVWSPLFQPPTASNPI